MTHLTARCADTIQIFADSRKESEFSQVFFTSIAVNAERETMTTHRRRNCPTVQMRCMAGGNARPGPGAASPRQPPQRRLHAENQ